METGKQEFPDAPRQGLKLTVWPELFGSSLHKVFSKTARNTRSPAVAFIAEGMTGKECTKEKKIPTPVCGITKPVNEPSTIGREEGRKGKKKVRVVRSILGTCC